MQERFNAWIVFHVDADNNAIRLQLSLIDSFTALRLAEYARGVVIGV